MPKKFYVYTLAFKKIFPKVMPDIDGGDKSNRVCWFLLEYSTGVTCYRKVLIKCTAWEFPGDPMGRTAFPLPWARV